MTFRKTAKDVAEDALRMIGAFPPSRAQADAAELRTSMRFLEDALNHLSGIRPLAGFWEMVDIPLESMIGDYPLSDYAGEAQVVHVFSVSIIRPDGSPDPLRVMFESDGDYENLKSVGTPERAVITRDVNPILKLYPTPTQANQDEGYVARVRFQTYQTPLDPDATGDVEVKLRPAWSLYIKTKLAYIIGNGPVRRLNNGILERFQGDYMLMERELLARDGQFQSGKPPVTDPMEGMV